MDILSCATFSLVASHLGLLGYAADPEHAAGLLPFAVSFVLSYATVKFYRIFLYHRYDSPLRLLPGPTENHWFLGQAINQVNAATPMAFAVSLSKANPEAALIRYLSLANTEIILVNSLEAHQQVLQTYNARFERPNAMMRMIRRFSENGLASFEGDEYQRHRGVLSRCFTPNCLQRLEPMIKGKTTRLKLLFDRAIEAGGGASAIIDCTDTFGRFSLDVMGRALLGTDFSYLEDIQFDRDGNPLERTREYGVLDVHNTLFGPDKKGKVFTFMDCFIRGIRFIPCDTNTEFFKATGWMHDMVKQRVANRRRELTTGNNDTSHDILTFLIRESMPGRPANFIEDKHIIGHLKILMAGGHETTAHMLAWSSHVLATKQEIQARLRADINSLAEKKRDPSFKEIDALPYLKNFVKEVLRVYPPAVWTPRQACQNIQIAGTYIPKGTLFEIVPAVTHMNKLIWGEDADQFNPARWDTIGGDDDPRSKAFAFMSFSNGPKMCIGKRLALCEIKIALYEMVRTYRFRPVEHQFTVETPGIVLRPRGMKVRVQKIAQA